MKSDSHPAQTADGKWAVKLSYLRVYYQNSGVFFSEISGSVHNQKFQWGKLIVLKLFSNWEIKILKSNFFHQFDFFLTQYSCFIGHYFKTQFFRMFYPVVLTWVFSALFFKQCSPGRKNSLEGSYGCALKQVA